MQGELHEQQCLARWRAEVPGTYAISEEQAEKLRKWTEDYRGLRKARAELRRWSKAVLEILSQVERLRTVSEETLQRNLGGGRWHGENGGE